MTKNIILETDSYKLGHHNQYPHDTQNVFSYLEARKGAKYPVTVFFGLQQILKDYLEGAVVTQEKINYAKALAAAHFGDSSIFNEKGWQYILDKHEGRLPVRIKAVAEGSVIPIDNALMTVEVTDETVVAWLTNALESVLLHVWAPITVATKSYTIKKAFKQYLDKTSDNPNAINFMLHDFGYRGVSSSESAAIEGAGHLINFLGTDTLVAMMLIHSCYPEVVPSFDNLAYSVPATEHSVMTARGKEGESEVVGQLIREYPNGILSVVADSFDIYNFVDNIVGKQYKEDILKRNGVFVTRPDSITPTHPTPESLVVWILESLQKNFGVTINSKSYKVLHPKVRVLWGDGIDEDGIMKILDAANAAGFSAENLVFGMGGGLLQKINRDTQRFAFKSSAQKRGGEWFEIFKHTIDPSKRSKRGRLKLIKIEGAHGYIYQTVKEDEYPEYPNLLETVFENGKIIKTHTFSEIRARAAF